MQYSCNQRKSAPFALVRFSVLMLSLLIQPACEFRVYSVISISVLSLYLMLSLMRVPWIIVLSAVNVPAYHGRNIPAVFFPGVPENVKGYLLPVNGSEPPHVFIDIYLPDTGFQWVSTLKGIIGYFIVTVYCNRCNVPFNHYLNNLILLELGGFFPVLNCNRCV